MGSKRSDRTTEAVMTTPPFPLFLPFVGGSVRMVLFTAGDARHYVLARPGAGPLAPGALLVAPSPGVGYGLQEGEWGASHG